MNLINDIKDLLKYDTSHILRIELSSSSLKIYLEYDLDLNKDDTDIIPIEYSFIDDIIYIPNNEFNEMYNPSDYGLDINDINIIYNIMNYLNKYREEIKELCYGFDVIDRDIYKEKSNKQNIYYPDINN